MSDNSLMPARPSSRNRLYVCSWNVASWPTCSREIISHHSSLHVWLSRHAFDILCLQEVKTRHCVLETSPQLTLSGQGSPVGDSYDTFWAPNRTKTNGGGDSGFNGVATIARKGLTKRACATPLLDENDQPDEELNAEGRCIMTDHGTFVLFNVYVPAGQGSERAPRKMRFLRALRRAMQHARRTRRVPVILAGDMNIARLPKDVSWKWRLMCCDDVWGKSKETSPALATLPPQVAEAVWRAKPAVEAALASKEVSFVPGKKSGNAQQYARADDSYVVRVPTPAGGRVTVGNKFDSEEEVNARLSRMERVVPDAIEGNAPLMIWPPNVLAINHLATLLQAAGVILTEAQQTAMSNSAGRSYSAPCFQSFFNDALLGEDRMVDTFSELHPKSVDRFTCWEQYKNSRYINEGARIDYIVVDKEIFQAARTAGVPLPCASTSRECTGEAAKNACLGRTQAGEQYQPAPFEGGGMPEPPTKCLEQQFRDATTGIVYMPPHFSDHVAVTLLLEWDDPRGEGGVEGAWRGPLPGSIALESDAATRMAQPHKTHRSIRDMFAAAASTGTRKPSVSSQSAKPTPPSSSPPGGVGARAKPTPSGVGARAKPAPPTAAASKPGARKSGIAAMFKAHEAKRTRHEE